MGSVLSDFLGRKEHDPHNRTLVPVGPVPSRVAKAPCAVSGRKGAPCTISDRKGPRVPSGDEGRSSTPLAPFGMWGTGGSKGANVPLPNPEPVVRLGRVPEGPVLLT